MTNKTQTYISVTDEDGGVHHFKGRVAWALRSLMEAGAKGCTPIDHPGPRWAAYVHKLRNAGINVATITETHGGPFPGSHARYVLETNLSVIERKAA